MKKLYLFTLIALFSSAMFGQVYWTAAAPGTWSDVANWTGGVLLPTATDEVRFGKESTEICTVEAVDAVAGRLKLGQDGPATMLIKTGAKLTVTGTDWHCIGENALATLTVEKDATLDLGNHHNYIGRSGGSAIVDIYGTITSTSSLGIDKGNKGADCIVTIHDGGTLAARYISSDGMGKDAIVDIRGGTLKFFGNEDGDIANFISQGRIIAYGGGGTIVQELIDEKTVVTSVEDATAPTIASSSPADAEIGVPNARPIVITFSKWMDNASVEAALTVSPTIANASYTWAQNTLTIAGDEMADLTAYTVTIGTGATDVNGIAIESALTFGFTTIDPAAPPVVVTTVPADGATGISEGAPIVVNFSKAMDPTSTEAAISSVPALVNPIATWSDGDRSVSIAHDNAPWNQVYTVTVAAGAKAGADATVLAADFTYSFTVNGMSQTTIVWNPAQDGTSDGLWTTAANWTLNTVPDYPDYNYKIVTNVAGATALILDDTVTVNNLRLGDGGPGDTLIIKDKGYLETTGDWNGFGYNGDTAVVIIEAGGTLDLSSHAWIGYKDKSLGKIDVSGTFIIRGSTGLDWADDGGKGLVTVHEGGVMNIRSLNDFVESGKGKSSINAGSVIDLDGGVLELNRHQQLVAKDYIAAERIIAFGGDGIVRVLQDSVFTETDTTLMTYVTTTMVANTDATLSSITSDVGGALTPAFDPAVTSYDLVVPMGTIVATIGGVATDVYATATVVQEMPIVLAGVDQTEVVITVTAEDGSTQDYTLNVTVSEVSVADQIGMKANAYYLPSNDLVRIVNASSVEMIKVVDITGRVRINQIVSNTETIEIDAAELKHGIYIIQLKSTDNTTQSSKFVK